MTTKLVGSGCQYCNPEYWDEHIEALAQPAQEPEIEALKLALEALEDVGVLTDREWQAVHKNKANELRQAIAELESQEPWCMKMNGCTAKCEDCPDYVPPAQPAQEPWPDLTKRDRESYRKGHDAGVAHHKQAVKAALAQPAQRPWVEPTEIEWFNWWRVSKIADETEAEIDFADFLIIAQAVSAKLKEQT
jgi:hypothetical protein